MNGHKRVRAAEVAGLDAHPVEVVDVTDEQARELFALPHRELALNSDPDALADFIFTVTGELSREHAEVKTVVENHGGTVADAIDDSVDYLVVGDHPDDDRRGAAEQAGVPTLDEQAFTAVLDEHGVDYPP